MLGKRISIYLISCLSMLISNEALANIDVDRHVPVAHQQHLVQHSST